MSKSLTIEELNKLLAIRSPVIPDRKPYTKTEIECMVKISAEFAKRNESGNK